MADIFDRLSADLAARYTVEREISNGGMATVYLAENLKQQTTIAFNGGRHDPGE